MDTNKVLSCKVINVEPDPRATGRTIVSVELDDGSGDGPWIKAFSMINPPRPITVEELAEMLASENLERPVDPWHKIRASIDQHKIVKLDLSLNLSAKAKH